MRACIQSQSDRNIPQTIRVKLAPLLATILWRWLGKLAMPIPAPEDDIMGKGGFLGRWEEGKEWKDVDGGRAWR